MFVFNADILTYEQAYNFRLENDPLFYNIARTHIFYLPETVKEETELIHKGMLPTHYSMILYQLKNGWLD